MGKKSNIKIGLIMLTLCIISCTAVEKDSIEDITKPSTINVISENEEKIYSIAILRDIYENQNLNNSYNIDQNDLYEKWEQEFFAVWEKKSEELQQKDVLKYENIDKLVGILKDERYIEKVKEKMDLESYPNILKRAITIKLTDLKVMPYEYNFLQCKGEKLQSINILKNRVDPGTPLLIINQSKDGEWFFIKSSMGYGWIKSSDVAFVDEAFIKRWKTGEYLVGIKENISIYDQESLFRFKSNIGTILPIKSKKINSNDDKYKIILNDEVWFGTDNNKGQANINDKISVAEEEYYEIFVPVQDENKNAVIKTSKISKDNGVKLPYELNENNLIRIIEELSQENMNECFERRYNDIELINDIFKPFAINGINDDTEKTVIDIENIDVENKKQIIKNNAISLKTLLYTDEEIILYMGIHQGEILVLSSGGDNVKLSGLGTKILQKVNKLKVLY